MFLFSEQSDIDQPVQEVRKMTVTWYMHLLRFHVHLVHKQKQNIAKRTNTNVCDYERSTVASAAYRFSDRVPTGLHRPPEMSGGVGQIKGT